MAKIVSHIGDFLQLCLVKPSIREHFSQCDRAGSGAKQSGNSGMNLSQRELSALARGEPNPDAPVLGELRAPQNKGSSTDDKFNKTGAQEAREKRHRAMGHYRDRSRSRDRRRRALPRVSLCGPLV